MSLIIILAFLLISLYLFGLTPSISHLHYRYLSKFGFWGYTIFPSIMIIWATLVIHERTELFWSGVGLYFVAIYCMFKYSKEIEIPHYLGATGGIVYLMFHVWSWHWWLVLVFIGLSIISTKSHNRTYIIEVLALIILYIYLYGS